MKILFLTAAIGGGHVKAAQALMHQMEKQLPCCETYLVDSLKYINPAIDSLITGTYLHTIKTVPRLYGKLYDLSEKDEFITYLARGFNHKLSSRLTDLLEQYNPDAVVCTHTMPLQMMSWLKKKGLFKMPVIGIVTDFTNHSFWKLEGVDAFIVAHECIKTDMINMGIQGESIHSFGIPVMEDFLTVKDRGRLLKDMGLEDKPTLLIMGGSLGFGGLQSMFLSLLKLPRDIQIIAVTGCNKKLQERLEKLAHGTKKNVRVLGYSKKISELMDVADLLITKPGGITVSEALAKKLPFLIMTPIPGQEERNASFLIDSGAAIRLTRYSDMEAVLKMTLDKPLIMQQMSAAAAKLAKPDACKDIAKLVGELVSKEAPVT